MRVAAIVVAAGRGERLDDALPKALVRVSGRTLLGHSISALAASPMVDAVLPVLPAGIEVPDDAHSTKSLPAVVGGARRQDSVEAGLDALPEEFEWVAVHDAARALVRASDVTRVIVAAQKHGAALLAVPLADTLKRVEDQRVVGTPDRAHYWVAQTPQVFRVGTLRRALERGRADPRPATDCAQLVEAMNEVVVRVVEGDPGNWKITYRADVHAAERILAKRGA